MAGGLFFGRVGLTSWAEVPELVVVVIAAVVSMAEAAVAVGEGEAEEVPLDFISGLAGTLFMTCLSLAGFQYSATRFMSALFFVRVIDVMPLGIPL
ncbi:hypothetical protein DKM19_40030 [Streptosporangium sp. 'caverna']|nr:hypothetical protein DKM19_40030 [Streptosporangium sp. 'caverna']